MNIKTNAASELATATELLEVIEKIEDKAKHLSQQFRFLTVADVMELKLITALLKT